MIDVVLLTANWTADRPGMFADKGSQDLHNRPAQLGRVAGDLLQCVDRTKSGVQLLSLPKLVDRLTEPLRDLTPSLELR